MNLARFYLKTATVGLRTTAAGKELNCSVRLHTDLIIFSLVDVQSDDFFQFSTVVTT